MLRRKLMINIIVFAVCGAIALTIPVFVNYWHKTTASASEQTYTLTSTFLGKSNHFQDARVMWQICLMSGDTVVATWEDIYRTASINNSITFDTENLTLTPNGFCYRGLATTADFEKLYERGYSSSVTYNGYSCVLQLQ